MKLGVRFPWGLFAVLGLFSPAPPVLAQDSGSVRGLVTNSAGDPVHNVAVAVVPQGVTTERRDTTTDQFGRFDQAGLTPGHYTVSAEIGDLGSQIFRILIQGGGATDVHFVLEAGRAAAAWLRAPGNDTAAAATAFESGVQANRAGDIEQAIEHFNAALRVMPSCLDCHFNIGIAYSEQGQFEAAEAAFRKALDIRADYAAAYYGLSNLYSKQNRPAEAAEARSEANRITVRSLEAGKDRARETLARGRAFLISGNVEDATRQFDAALATDPTLVDAYYWLGRAHDGAGNPSAARRSLTRYLGASPAGEFAEDARRRLEALDR